MRFWRFVNCYQIFFSRFSHYCAHHHCVDYYCVDYQWFQSFQSFWEFFSHFESSSIQSFREFWIWKDFYWYSERWRWFWRQWKRRTFWLCEVLSNFSQLSSCDECDVCSLCSTKDCLRVDTFLIRVLKFFFNCYKFQFVLNKSFISWLMRASRFVSTSCRLRSFVENEKR